MATVTNESKIYDVKSPGTMLVRGFDLFCDSDPDEGASLEFRVPSMHGGTWHELKPGEHLPLIALPGATIDQLWVRGMGGSEATYRAVPTIIGGR